jgi:hypothetical protein
MFKPNLQFSHKSCIKNYYLIFYQIVPIWVIANVFLVLFETYLKMAQQDATI